WARISDLTQHPVYGVVVFRNARTSRRLDDESACGRGSTNLSIATCIAEDDSIGCSLAGSGIRETSGRVTHDAVVVVHCRNAIRHRLTFDDFFAGVARPVVIHVFEHDPPRERVVAA